KQVPDYLLQTIRVAGDDLEPPLIVSLDLDLLCFDSMSDCVERGIDHRDQIDWSKMKLKFASDDARDVENVFNDLFLRPGISFNHFNRVGRTLIVEAPG